MSEAIRNPQASMARQAMIQMENINKWYGTFQVLKNINLTVHQASVSCSAARRDRANRPLFAA